MNVRQILMSTPAGSLFPAERTHIEYVWRSDPVSKAFQKMISNQILSVPVYDQNRRSFAQFLDMVDLVAFAVSHVTSQQGTLADPAQLMDVPLLQTVNCGDVADLSKRNPFFPVESNAPLLEVLNLMVKWGVHRIPIVDAEGDLMTIITQSQLSTFIYKYLSSFPLSLSQQPASSIAASISIPESTGENKPNKVISVSLSDRAIDAFIAMHENRVSGVAVIDGSGTIVGNISASDVKAIRYDGTLLTRLFYPVSEFLALVHPTDDAIPTAEKQTLGGALVVPPTATFGVVLGTLVNSHIHRVYVVDDEQRPIGIIGHAEILRAVQASLQAKGPQRDSALYF